MGLTFASIAEVILLFLRLIGEAVQDPSPAHAEPAGRPGGPVRHSQLGSSSRSHSSGQNSTRRQTPGRHLVSSRGCRPPWSVGKLWQHERTVQAVDSGLNQMAAASTMAASQGCLGSPGSWRSSLLTCQPGPEMHCCACLLNLTSRFRVFYGEAGQSLKRSWKVLVARWTSFAYICPALQCPLSRKRVTL